MLLNITEMKIQQAQEMLNKTEHTARKLTV